MTGDIETHWDGNGGKKFKREGTEKEEGGGVIKEVGVGGWGQDKNEGIPRRQ